MLLALPPLRPAPPLPPLATGKPPRYHVVALPKSLDAAALNNRGEVVGIVTTYQGKSLAALRHRAAHWKAGRLRLLSTLRWPLEAASAINENGIIAGNAGVWYQSPGADSDRHVVLWKGKRAKNLGALPDLSSAAVHAINRHCQIVGAAGPSSGRQLEFVEGSADGAISRAFLWTGMAMLDLDGGSANDINERGQIVGENGGRALLWQPGEKRFLCAGKATAINNRGQIVGAAGLDGIDHRTDAVAFVYQNRAWRALSVPGFRFSQAMDINDRGQIAGYGENRTFDDDARAVLWHAGAAQDLNRLIPPGSGWTLRHARAINNRGQILGTGTYQGKPRGFLLVPVKDLARVGRPDDRAKRDKPPG